MFCVGDLCPRAGARDAGEARVSSEHQGRELAPSPAEHTTTNPGARRLTRAGSSRALSPSFLSLCIPANARIRTSTSGSSARSGAAPPSRTHSWRRACSAVMRSCEREGRSVSVALECVLACFWREGISSFVRFPEGSSRRALGSLFKHFRMRSLAGSETDGHG